VTNAPTTQRAPAEPAPSGVGAGLQPLPALKDRVRALVDSWTELQSGSWNAMAASAQYEELERISATAEQLKATEVGDPAVELAVYLCTFVEGRIYPSNSQRARMNELVGRLRAVTAPATSKSAAAKPRDRAAEHRSVLYLRARATEMPGLATQLGRHRYVVRPCETVEQARALIEEGPPDALIVDAAAIAHVGELLEHTESARGDVQGRVTCLVVGDLSDVSKRLFAQRAGADALVDTTDPLAIATRLDELFAQQRNLNYRVLIVEDDRGQALFCESVLQHRGIVSKVCLTPDVVLDTMAEFKPDLVLLDLYLPGMNGIEVAQLIRERPDYQFLPIVFLSGETDLDKRFDAIRMGGDDFITKPVKPRHLILNVETRIRRARMLPQRGEGVSRAERRGSLVSRVVFMDEVKRAIDSQAASSTALVYITLDGAEKLRDRLGLVRTGALSQQLAAALAGETDLVRPICAYGDFAFLSLMRGDQNVGIKPRMEQLRERLSNRRWLSAEDAIEPRFVIAGVQTDLNNEADELIARARDLGEEAAQKFLGAVLESRKAPEASAEDPALRLARTLLRGPLIAEAIRIEFQAMVPLKGELAGQYAVRFGLVAPKATTRMEVNSERLRALARDLGTCVSTDRQCLRRALAGLADRVQRGDEMRLFLPISIESALDPAFAPWLAAEMQSHALAPASVAMELQVEEVLREFARWNQALDSLQLVGTRLCVSGLQGGEAHLRLVRTGGPTLFKLAAPAPIEGGGSAWAAERGRLILEAAKHGKVTVATGVRDSREFAELLKLGVHYVQSDLFAPWSTDANFDFAGAKL
jgi:DNA-binding response OmpR family regulator/EAL domain-containing protein (putative c-di-GMP-specific phosphodiesterase class I)